MLELLRVANSIGFRIRPGRFYARQTHDRDMVIWVTEIKVRAERRTGEVHSEPQNARHLPLALHCQQLPRYGGRAQRAAERD